MSGEPDGGQAPAPSGGQASAPHSVSRPNAKPKSGTHSGRRPGPGGSREQILAAARASFGDRGYDGATMRDIAARAGVDPALVHHFYGSKQQLFIAAMELPFDLRTLLPEVIGSGPEHMAERFLRMFLGLWETPSTRPLFEGLLRSATTDPVAADMLRQLLSEGPLLFVAQALNVPDARLRATLAGSHAVGLAIVRYVVGVEPLASADFETVIKAVAPTIQHYLTGELGADLES